MMMRFLFLVLILGLGSVCQAGESGDYRINAGDALEIFIWNEDTLTREVRVRPDGFISLPLAGELRAGGQTPAQLTSAISAALKQYLNDAPVVTVSLVAMDGNLVYVLGKVQRPGAFPVATAVDVTQALAWAGGLNAFADEKDIQVLRRNPDGTQQALPFNYAGVKSGNKLDSNILLKSGDVVLVP